MYYDEITKTWFSNEVECYSYHTTGATWDGFNAIYDAYEAGREDAAEDMIDYRDYDRMEEEAGDYSRAVDFLKEALLRALVPRTTREERNAIRAMIAEGVPAAVLEELPDELLRAEAAPRRGHMCEIDIPFN